jgi:hypothetical protein
MARAPVALDVEPHLSYQSLLYETVRLGQTWGEALVTVDGPLAAVQAPAYASGSIWMAMSWQIGGNLLLAAVLVGAAYQLPWKRRWWALGLLAATLARVPTLAPWLAMVLLGWTLIRSRAHRPTVVFALAGGLGFLALSSLGHLLLGVLALGLNVLTARPSRDKRVAVSGFIAAVLIGWIVLGQPLPGLWLWLSRGFPALWQTPPPLDNPELISAVKIWAAASGIGLIVTLAWYFRSAGRQNPFPAAIFLAGAATLAWSTVALQPFGLPAIFFGTIIVAAFLLLQAGGKTAASVGLAALAFGGLARWQPLIFTDGIGHFNRQLILNVKMVAAIPSLRSGLREEVKQSSTIHELPRIKAIVGEAPIDLIGGPPSQIILSKLKLRSRPAPIKALVRSPAIAELNRKAMAAPDAPEFILQRLQSPDGLVPAMEDATATIELYRRYEFVLEEEGLMLWRRKKNSAGTPAPVLVRAGTLSLGESLSLPPHGADVAYWLELEVRPNLLGRLWSSFDEISQPGLLVRDQAGHELRYALPASVAASGFLIEPFVRGEPDLLRLQTGSDLPPVSAVAVTSPIAGAFLWNTPVNYRLYSVPDLKLTGNKLPSNAFERFRLFNRVPIALAYLFPIKVLPYEPGVDIAFAHPASSVEFAVTSQDRRIRATFGILKAAYQGNNATDGVDFSVEFVAADGLTQILYHRHLNPLSLPEDRGLQKLDVALPPGQAGRLLLRTYNPPERNQAYDWSYWGRVTIE